MINRGKELICIRSIFHKNPNLDDITWDISNIFPNFSVSTEDIQALVSGAENVIALVGKGRGDHRVSNAINDVILHSRNIAKEYNIFTANKVIVKLLYHKSNPIKMCETTCILNLNTFFCGDPNGEDFNKLYEEEADDVAPSDVIADKRIFSEMRFGDANSWTLKCSASESESDDSEITALILASNLKPF